MSAKAANKFVVIWDNLYMLIMLIGLIIGTMVVFWSVLNCKRISKHLAASELQILHNLLRCCQDLEMTVAIRLHAPLGPQHKHHTCLADWSTQPHIAVVNHVLNTIQDLFGQLISCIADYDQQVSVKDEHNEHLQAQLTTAQGTIDTMKTEHTAETNILRSNIGDLTESKEKLHTEVKDLKDSETKSKTEIADLKKSSTKKDTELKKCQRDLTATNGTIDNYESKLKTKRDRNIRLIDELSEERSQRMMFEEESQNLRAEAAGRDIKLHNKESIISEQNTQITDLSGQITSAKVSHEQELKAVKDVNASLSTSLAAKQALLEGCIRQIHAMKDCVVDTKAHIGDLVATQAQEQGKLTASIAGIKDLLHQQEENERRRARAPVSLSTIHVHADTPPTTNRELDRVEDESGQTKPVEGGKKPRNNRKKRNAKTKSRNDDTGAIGGDEEPSENETDSRIELPTGDSDTRVDEPHQTDRASASDLDSRPQGLGSEDSAPSHIVGLPPNVPQGKKRRQKSQRKKKAETEVDPLENAPVEDVKSESGAGGPYDEHTAQSIDDLPSLHDPTSGSSTINESIPPRQSPGSTNGQDAASLQDGPPPAGVSPHGSRGDRGHGRRSRGRADGSVGRGRGSGYRGTGIGGGFEGRERGGYKGRSRGEDDWGRG